MPVRRALAAAGLLLFLLGWVIALIGVGLAHSKCDDENYYLVTGQEDSTVARPTADQGCERLFRFPWFVIALCLIPVIFSILAIIKPHAGSATNAALFSVIAALSMLMTNYFYNLHDLSSLYSKRFEIDSVAIIDDNVDDDDDDDDAEAVIFGRTTDLYDKYERRVKIAIAGFALMSAGALLNILLAALLQSKSHHRPEEHVHHETVTRTEVLGVTPVRNAAPAQYLQGRTEPVVGVTPVGNGGVAGTTPARLV